MPGGHPAASHECAKEDVAPRLWTMVYSPTLSSQAGGGSVLQVAGKFKVRLGIYPKENGTAKAALSLPKLGVSGLLVKEERSDQAIGEGRDAGYSSDESSFPSLGETLDGTVIVHGVCAWLEAKEVFSMVEG